MKDRFVKLGTFSQWKVAPYLFYLFFLVSFWLIHIIIISGISSIHFSLGHDLSITENWIFAHGWPLVIFSSSISFYLLYRLLQIVSFDNPFHWLFHYGTWGHYRRRSIVAILYFYFVIFYMGRTVNLHNVGISLFEQLINALGSFLQLIIYFGLQLVLVKNYFPVFKLEKILFLIITWISYVFVFESTVLYQIHSVRPYYLFLLLLSMTLIGDKHFWNIGSYFLLFAISPVVLLFGLDPIYSFEYSIARFEQPFNMYYLALCIFFIILYIYSDRWIPWRKNEVDYKDKE